MKTEAFSGLTCFQTPGLFQRIKLRTEAVASVVNFRTVQNFCPVWSEGVGSTCRKCGSAKNNWFDEETHEVKEIWAALKFTTLATASVLS